MPEETVSQPVAPSYDKTRVNLFTLMGTEGCKLDCPDWERFIDIISLPTGRNSIKRARNKKREEFLTGRDTESIQKPNRKKRISFRFNEMAASAGSGCGSCKFLSRVLDRILLEHVDLARDAVVFEWLDYHYSLRITSQDTGRSREFQLFCDSDSTTAIFGMHSAQTLSGVTSNIGSLQTARGWVRHCDAAHDACRADETTKLPKRVLDCVELVKEGEPGIRLIEDRDISARFACLSHCWGTTPMPVLTKTGTISENLDFIAWNRLPKTFRDAITITRALGLQYLWIDSLCIIQDSEIDWQIESSKMGDVYSNGYITIAAVSSPDSKGGCFPCSPLEDICLDMPLKDGLKAGLGVREKSTEDFSCQKPLLTRAWVYQERMLSRRTLLCHHRELQFECRTRFTCQCGNNKIAPHMDSRHEAQLRAKREHNRNLNFSKTMQSWLNAVTTFSSLRITKGSDKLPALSACASNSASGRGRYLAGLWEQTFAEDLLWITEPTKPTETETPGRPKWRVPSWSWASVDADSGVRFPAQIGKSQASLSLHAFRKRIVEVNCTPRGLNKFGEVVDGYLRLRARLIPGKVRSNCPSCTLATRKGQKYIFESTRHYERLGDYIKADCRSKEYNPLIVPREVEFDFFPDFLFEDSTFEFTHGSAGGSSCRLAPIWTMYMYDVSRRHGDTVILTRTMYFMVLKHVPSELAPSTGEHYERVGIVRAFLPSVKAMVDWERDILEPLSTEEQLITLR
ncbi:HET domain-containing protein [Apiospora marii]|uniref:HET domain-containing protein n=1 Tax=Apiospora marii TaxID=335849 RepID=UPI0031325AC1